MSKKTKGDLTSDSIRKAYLRIKHGQPKIISIDRKISISAVAEEASVSRATIHNNYPELAKTIREANSKFSPPQSERQELIKLKTNNQSLRQKLRQLKLDLAKLASINAAFFIENKELKLIIDSKNILSIK